MFQRFRHLDSHAPRRDAPARARRHFSSANLYTMRGHTELNQTTLDQHRRNGASYNETRDEELRQFEQNDIGTDSTDDTTAPAPDTTALYNTRRTQTDAQPQKDSYKSETSNPPISSEEASSLSTELELLSLYEIRPPAPHQAESNATHRLNVRRRPT